ncbi:ribosome-binding factor A [candidate division WOR-1 bacterium RIFOXYA12_FULL_52_29]|uniref:Ribosome-binding factor A n=1 Tax=candidate division WOR-1 bacterium RIFOXYC12_FULL_54_18 TaxID=1802584 RepID=A0A1F4T4H0_UNCSA|nr:MAG: ribosome-binding factor A [candidate division WOR-1 bacterium RIFOXYA2_FULL_51_19]OGC17181.1 MAG: ribosome-binding factor A [candidate division WOR-1 bacterium RIFOXYA12_FULL_52_29]OGC26041.1 MAG: ribosome-binding factor A [candidate division WOR-1 bacterium RIFOXYB2_FULL_45_9]OGC27598.1 MAG: ribosome-binding factor A [candidate division WOR-1 bacterium RIFOXYC12_FULL_54_18]OGC29188.1 MAG: ribosome-binding factor A [candidate division WOR-1 bacterium RIFOXYB12_FULL_52_16]
MTRQERIEGLIQEEISTILREEVNDPRIGFVSITKVEISPDLRNANIHVSIFGDEKQKEEAMDGLRSATRFIRGELGNRVDFRATPEIRFIRDDSLEKGSKVLNLIRKLKNEEPNKRTAKKG